MEEMSSTRGVRTLPHRKMEEGNDQICSPPDPTPPHTVNYPFLNPTDYFHARFRILHHNFQRAKQQTRVAMVREKNSGTQKGKSAEQKWTLYFDHNRVPGHVCLCFSLSPKIYPQHKITIKSNY
jgi:hypothetical protein